MTLRGTPRTRRVVPLSLAHTPDEPTSSCSRRRKNSHEIQLDETYLGRLMVGRRPRWAPNCVRAVKMRPYQLASGRGTSIWVPLGMRVPASLLLESTKAFCSIPHKMASYNDGTHARSLGLLVALMKAPCVVASSRSPSAFSFHSLEANHIPPLLDAVLVLHLCQSPSSSTPNIYFRPNVLVLRSFRRWKLIGPTYLHTASQLPRTVLQTSFSSPSFSLMPNCLSSHEPLSRAPLYVSSLIPHLALDHSKGIENALTKCPDSRARGILRPSLRRSRRLSKLRHSLAHLVCEIDRTKFPYHPVNVSLLDHAQDPRRGSPV